MARENEKDQRFGIYEDMHDLSSFFGSIDRFYPFASDFPDIRYLSDIFGKVHLGRLIEIDDGSYSIMANYDGDEWAISRSWGENVSVISLAGAQKSYSIYFDYREKSLLDPFSGKIRITVNSGDLTMLGDDKELEFLNLESGDHDVQLEESGGIPESSFTIELLPAGNLLGQNSLEIARVNYKVTISRGDDAEV